MFKIYYQTLFNYILVRIRSTKNIFHKKNKALPGSGAVVGTAVVVTSVTKIQCLTSIEYAFI